MPPTSITFRRSAARGWAFVLLGVFSIATAVFFATDPSHLPQTPLLKYLLLVGLASPGLVIIGIGLSQVADRSPKLTVDEEGLVNHTTPGGDRKIAWRDIQGLETLPDPLPRRGWIGSLILHLRDGHGGMPTEWISLAGLEGGQLHVFTEVKRLWLEATAPPASGGPTAATPGSPTEPGATPDTVRM